MTCKFMRTKYNYTPNDYDIYFDFTSIPSNVIVDDTLNLEKRIAQVTPLSKKVHLNFNTSKGEYKQNVEIVSSLKINNKEVLFL